MLVLSRQRDERVVIGNREVLITIVAIRGDKVRLGFEADPGVSIHREEIFENIVREKRAARRVDGASGR